MTVLESWMCLMMAPGSMSMRRRKTHKVVDGKGDRYLEQPHGIHPEPAMDTGPGAGHLFNFGDHSVGGYHNYYL